MEEKKFPEPVEALVLIIILFFVVFIGAAVFAAVLVMLGGEDSPTAYSRVIFILGGIPYLIVPILYARHKNYDINRLFRLTRIDSTAVYFSLAIGVSATIVLDELDRIIQEFITYPDFFLELNQILQAQGVFDWLLLILGVVILASLSEELMFRGFLQVTLERKGDVTRAVLLSSLTWTLIHGNPYWAVQIFIIGVIIGFLAWRSGSVIPGIIVHAVNNMISLFDVNYEGDMSWYLMGDHVSPFIVIPALAVLIFFTRKFGDYFRGSEPAPTDDAG